MSGPGGQVGAEPVGEPVAGPQVGLGPTQVSGTERLRKRRAVSGTKPVDLNTVAPGSTANANPRGISVVRHIGARQDVVSSAAAPSVHTSVSRDKTTPPDCRASCRVCRRRRRESRGEARMEGERERMKETRIEQESETRHQRAESGRPAIDARTGTSRPQHGFRISGFRAACARLLAVSC